MRAELNLTLIYPTCAADFFTPLRNKMTFLVLARMDVKSHCPFVPVFRQNTKTNVSNDKVTNSETS